MPRAILPALHHACELLIDLDIVWQVDVLETGAVVDCVRVVVRTIDSSRSVQLLPVLTTTLLGVNWEDGAGNQGQIVLVVTRSQLRLRDEREATWAVCLEAAALVSHGNELISFEASIFLTLPRR